MTSFNLLLCPLKFNFCGRRLKTPVVPVVDNLSTHSSLGVSCSLFKNQVKFKSLPVAVEVKSITSSETCKIDGEAIIEWITNK